MKDALCFQDKVVSASENVSNGFNDNEYKTNVWSKEVALQPLFVYDYETFCHCLFINEQKRHCKNDRQCVTEEICLGFLLRASV